MLILTNGPDNVTSDDELIYGRKGDDTIVSSHHPTATVYGGEGNDLIDGYYFNTERHFFGGDGADRLVGGGVADVLSGDNGADTLLGSFGEDVLDGGRGADVLDGGPPAGRFGETDTASYASATAAVRADIANPGSNTGDAAGDTYIDIEALLGSRYNDTLSGLGPHLLEGGAGADSIVGGTASYVGAPGGVRADLLAPTTNTGDAAGDTYLRVRHLAGSAHDDTLGGTDAENEVHGGAGNDVIQGRGGRDFLFGGDGGDQLFGGDDGDFLHGEGGDDTVSGGAGDDYLDANAGLDRFDGGAGIDTVDYFDSPWTLRADLSNPAHNAGDAEGDVYIGIENLFGGHFDDVLKGDNGPNLLVGREGDDLLIGLGGADRLRGEQGNDTIHGQGGNDYVEGGLGDDVLSGGAGGRDFFVTMLYGDDFPGDLSWGHDVITDFEDRIDVIDFRNAPNIHFSDLTITQEGLDTRIVGPADSSILLLNTSAATITAGDFLF